MGKTSPDLPPKHGYQLEHVFSLVGIQRRLWAFRPLLSWSAQKKLFSIFPYSVTTCVTRFATVSATKFKREKSRKALALWSTSQPRRGMAMGKRSVAILGRKRSLYLNVRLFRNKTWHTSSKTIDSLAASDSVIKIILVLPGTIRWHSCRWGLNVSIFWVRSYKHFKYTLLLGSLV